MTAGPRISLALAVILAAALGDTGGNISRADEPAPTLGQLSIHVGNEGDRQTDRPAGKVELLLTCTSPVAFAHRIHTSADGQLLARAPVGRCTLETVSGVRVGAKWYRWKLNLDIHRGTNAVNLTSDDAVLKDGEDEAPATPAPEPSPTTAVDDVPPVVPTSETILPVSLVTVAAEYPGKARQQRIEGKVILQAVVGTDGHISQARLFSSSNSIFNDPAMEALSEYLYLPARQDGRPIPVQYTVRMDFQLR